MHGHHQRVDEPPSADLAVGPGSRERVPGLGRVHLPLVVLDPLCDPQADGELVQAVEVAGVCASRGQQEGFGAGLAQDPVQRVQEHLHGVRSGGFNVKHLKAAVCQRGEL